MVSKIQKKQQKAKAREKENRQKRDAKRAEKTAIIRDYREMARLEKRARRIEREMDKHDEIMPADLIKHLPEDVISRMEHNIDILKALEDEHNQEMSKKSALNSQLEDHGYMTLEEKMAAVQQRETADVSVVKATSEPEIEIVD